MHTIGTTDHTLRGGAGRCRFALRWRRTPAAPNTPEGCEPLGWFTAIGATTLHADGAESGLAGPQTRLVNSPMIGPTGDDFNTPGQRICAPRRGRVSRSRSVACLQWIQRHERGVGFPHQPALGRL